jgi:hypothetical protein
VHKTSSLEHVGRTAGNLYAISTVASVASALVTGFFLIPSIGVHWLVVLIALALLATSPCSSSAAPRPAPRWYRLLFLGVALPRHRQRRVARRRRALRRAKPYAEIRVIEKPLERFR